MTDQSTTRLAETATRLDAARNTYYTELATLSDEALERIRSHARAWREAHDVHPDELMDIDLLLTDVDTYRAREANLLSRVGQLQGQLGTVRESLEYSTEENARLSASILDCGSDVHARVFDEEDDDDV